MENLTTSIPVLISLILLEITLLYLLSRHFIQKFGQFLFSIFHHQKPVILTLAFLFLPGTTIHELAHAITARILLVRTGKITLWPESSEEGIKLGSAQIGLCDPIRRMLIGFAPVFWGISILFGLIYISFRLIFIQQMAFSPYLILLITYLVFAISNTMFSSKKDQEGALEAFGIILVISFLIYITGFYQPLFATLRFIDVSWLIKVMQLLAIFLTGPILIDLLLWIIFNQILRI